MNFKLATFRFTIRPVARLILPIYKGSTLRGAFGVTFKRLVCVTREKTCAPCLLKSHCVYYQIFETPVPTDSAILSKYPFAPHPFVFTPPLNERQVYENKDELHFELTLIGKAVDYLAYFIYTFEQIGQAGIGYEKGKYVLDRVTANGCAPEQIIYADDKKKLSGHFPVLTWKELEQTTLGPQAERLDRLTLNFTTPTRIKKDEQLTMTLDFPLLVRTLLWRVSLLSYFHCGETLARTFVDDMLAKASGVKVEKARLRWLDWERYSNRQKTRMKMGGFVGDITFAGDLQKFLPLLRLGELIHVGKGTSFGLGKYNITLHTEETSEWM